MDESLGCFRAGSSLGPGGGSSAGVSAGRGFNIDSSLGNSPYNLGADITYVNETVATVGTGVLNQGAFTNTMTGNLTLGTGYYGGLGTYNLSGGSMSVNGNEYIGVIGEGSFI